MSSLSNLQMANSRNTMIENMCHRFPQLVLNLPAFYRGMIAQTKDEFNRLVFDPYELDLIVESALADKIPIVTAKRWAITN